VKYSDLSSKNRPLPLWAKIASASLLSIALAGCGGGSDGAAGAAGAAGATGATGATGPAGANLVATANVGTNAAASSATSAAAWKALAPQVTVTSVTIASPPVVSFTVKDAAGNPVVGLGNKSQSSSATVAGLTNVAFTLAKLVPGTNNEPSKWVSYNVVRPPTVTEKAGTVAATASCNADKTWCGTFPSTDTQGTLVDNGDGSYQYTFLRDPKQVATIVAGLTDSVDGLAKKADLGDLSFDATLTHRLGIQIGGAAPGTGSNTPTATTLTPGVNMVNTANAVYDFRPDGSAVTNTRDIVKIESCSGCHDGKVLAHGSRKDPKYCMTCHTDQIKYSFSQEASTSSAFVLNGTTPPTTAIVNGRALGNFPNMLHKIHMGGELVKTGYYFNADDAGKFNEVTYPQPVTNCVKCHDGSASAVNKTANGDNWKNVPSLLVCGACHDGINFATGTGATLADKAKDDAAGVAVGTTQTGHIGGAKANNATCVLCHDATTIPAYHVTVDKTGASTRGGYPLNPNQVAVTVPPTTQPPKLNAAYDWGQGPSIPLASQLNLPAGVHKIGLELKSVTVAASVAPAVDQRKATVVYRVLLDGAPVTLATTPLASCPTPPYTSKYYTACMIPGIDGTPDIYLAYGVPQDGQAADGSTVVDWNTTQNVHLSDIVATQGAPDANGWYTVTVNKNIPDNAKLITAGLGINYNGFVQIDNAAYKMGIRLREPGFAMMTATGNGNTARRTVVDNAKCNSCHGQLGVSPSFHSGARNNGAGCAFCHTPNTPGGHGVGGWSVSEKNLVHGIHASAKRAQAYSYGATATNPGGFQEVTYPGVLKDCQQCHVAGSYDFSASANSAAAPNLLWTTETNIDMTLSPALGLSPWVKTLVPGGLANFSTTVAGAFTATGNLVSSPISSSCFGCHDSATALSHMQLNGGSLYQPVAKVSVSGTSDRSLGFSKVEACAVCHGAGRDNDISLMHKK
jgi:OmcA/MtrC family decaheme c-type cytochrome